MNEKAMNTILEEIIRKVLEELGGQASAMPAASAASDSPDTGDGIPVELSARHAHLSEKDAITLFGAPLTRVRDLSQPGQFLCKERVRLIGPRGVIDNVAVLGPSRDSSQVEVSITDARSLGVETPVRQSGDVAGTPGIILASQNGVVGLEEGLIVAGRHIHMAPADAARFGVSDRDRVCVRLNSQRPVVFEDVLVRVNENFSLAMHIDLDEGNGCGWTKGVIAKIVRGKGE
ncbi:phosphate propanoyltransferase [Desulfobotulus mexicanus]|uniref:Phosphate propanoyltransferase n=1 Tax=Desulfobotulus mexicanus TaxID=2586642 RepID=A0A5S5MEZ2_9BACT|nr:phosphate propanoyltransferase [Desulfobotulus mexicanus]TYT74306.1 phosphate propanoyltransferase [Desulfobotulus mexicanus]